MTNGTIVTWWDFDRSHTSTASMLRALNAELQAKDKTLGISPDTNGWVLTKYGRRVRDQRFKTLKYAFDYVFPEAAQREAEEQALRTTMHEVTKDMDLPDGKGRVRL